MGKRQKLEHERLKRQKKKRRKQIIIGASISVCVITLIVVLAFNAQPSSSTLNIASDSNGDLHIAMDSLQNGLNYIDYGSDEELLLWKDSDGVIRTAFDTCE